MPATAAKDLSATQEDDACPDSDDDEGEYDSEDIDIAAAGPSGEYSQKCGAPCHAGMVGRGGEGRDAKHRILMRGCIENISTRRISQFCCSSHASSRARRAHPTWSREMSFPAMVLVQR